MRTRIQKAFQVDGDDYSVIVFSESRGKAHASGLCKLHEVDSVYLDWTDVQVRRAKWADRYAPGPIPMQAYLDNGWWFACWGCGERIDRDVIVESVESANPVMVGGDCIYCHSCAVKAGLFSDPGGHDDNL